MSNRILDYPEATAITSDDYILLDNEGTGAKCIKASALNINMDNYTIKEARGSIASFDDGEDLPLAFMGAYITALQDLHGYDYPWVGGSGRNLFNMGSKWSGSASGLSFTTDDDYVTMNGTKSGANYVTPSQLYFDLPAGTYYAKAFVISGTTSNAPSIYVYSNQELTSNMLNTERSFTIESQTSVGIRFAFWNDGATYSNYKIGIVISKTYDIDKFYPYSNICPISGWSAVDVTRCGKNLFDYTHFQFVDMGYINGYGVWEGSRTIKNYPTDNIGNEWNSLLIDVSALRSQNVSFSGFVGSTAIGIIDENFKVLYTMGTSVPASGSVDLSQYPTAKYLVLTFISSDYNFDNAQLEIGNQATTYTPYNGATYTIDLDGTRYGGTLDVVSGVLTVDRVGVNMGSLTWIYDQSLSRFYSTQISDKRDGLLNDDEIMCSCFRPNGAPVSGARIDGTIAIWDRCYVKWFEITDATVFKERVTGQTFTYPLATPLTIQLSKQQIKSLVGVNNIFADTGDSVVDYRKLWVMPEM